MVFQAVITIVEHKKGKAKMTIIYITERTNLSHILHYALFSVLLNVTIY